VKNWKQPIKKDNNQTRSALPYNLRASFKSVIQNFIEKGNGEIYRNNHRNNNGK